MMHNHTMPASLHHSMETPVNVVTFRPRSLLNANSRPGESNDVIDAKLIRGTRQAARI
jgi:hypothetical protein